MSRICIATTVSGTLRSFVVPTAVALRDMGHEVTLICSDDDDFAASLPEGVGFVPVRMERGISLSGFRATRQFSEIFRRGQFDLVQYSTPNASLYASVAAKRAKVPMRLYCQWGIRYVGMSGLVRFLFKRIEKYVCDNSTLIRSASPGNMHFAIKEGLYPPTKAGVIGNGGTIGVDLAQYDKSLKQKWRRQVRKRLGIPESSFVFGFSGRLCADKGCTELLQAFRRIAKEHSNAYLLIVGPFEEMNGIPKELASWANESNSVVMTGLVPNSQMREYYSAMDTLVHPTYREGFGMVIQEAGALALPVITTKVLGASEVMVDGESCLLVSPRSSEELILAMERLYMDKDFLHRMGGAAYERTIRRYSREAMLQAQMEFYASVLGKS